MKNKIGITLFTAFLAVVLMVSGCSNFSGPNGRGTELSSEGNLKLTIQGIGNARTIQPVVIYKATLTPATGDAIEATLLQGANILNLPAGTYAIDVEAYNGDVLVASGSVTGVTVTTTATVMVTVTLDLEDTIMEGDGTFKWNLTDFGSAVSVTIYEIGDLEDLDIDELDPDDAAGTGNTAIGSVTLPYGMYFVVFEVDGITWNEILWIGGGGIVSEYLPYFDNLGPGTAGNLLTDVLADIAEGEIATLTAPEFIALGVAGVSSANIGDIRTGMTTLIDDDAPPADLDELKVLVDAALVWASAPLADSSIQIAADAEIAGLVANGTDVTVSWTGFSSPDYNVSISVGTYTFTVSIIPPEEPEFFESLVLNENNAVYRFTLPAGEKFENYKAIKVSYKIAAADLVTDNPPGNTVRAIRLLGNYQTSAFALHTDNRYLHAPFDTYNAPYIYDDLAAGTRYGSARAALDAAGAEGDQWFTLTYLLVGNAPNQPAALDKYPAPDATGPFLFGVGIPGWGAKPQLVKNITMVHKTDPRKNVVTNDFYGLAGYADTRYETSSRAVVENPAFVRVEPEFVEELTLQQSYAVYRFTLPADAKFGDFNAIKVSYKMNATELAKGTNSSRLMGNYPAAKFTANGSYMFFQFGSAVDDTNANGPYIYQNNGGADGIPAGVTANTWFTISYPLVGNTPHAQFTTVGVARPADTDTGPFLFGIGLPGNDSADGSNAKTQLVKSITMVHKTDPRKNIVTDNFFGFVGYGGPSGLNWDKRIADVPNPDYVGTVNVFDIDLTAHTGAVLGDNTPFAGPAVGTNNSADGSVTFKYLTSTGNNEIGYLALTAEQTAMIQASSSLRVTLTGSSIPAAATFRSCFGNVTKNGDWNDTGWIIAGDNTVASVSGISQTFNVTRKVGTDGNPAPTNTHFLLQKRAGTPEVVGDDPVAGIFVTIKSIRVRCIQ